MLRPRGKIGFAGSDCRPAAWSAAIILLLSGCASTAVQCTGNGCSPGMTDHAPVAAGPFGGSRYALPGRSSLSGWQHAPDEGVMQYGGPSQYGASQYSAMPVNSMPCTTGQCDSGLCDAVTCGTAACGVTRSAGVPCETVSFQPYCDAPRELRKTTLPEYVVEPPDILLIEAVNNLRPAGAEVRAGEMLMVQVNRTVPYSPTEEPVAIQFKQINGLYAIGTDGYLDLGPEYGKVLVAEQPLTEIQRRVDAHLRQILTNPQVLVTLPVPENPQYVAGQHLVRPDGTVGLGIYGSVYVTGMTLQQARHAIEQHLSQYIHRPQVSVDVLAYNSKVYYVITDGGGAGEQVVRMPSTGNETVLDAVANIQGLPTVASKSAIWIARPSPMIGGPDQILKVDWNAIAQGAQTQTNFQMLPGDRLYVKASPMITFDTKIAKFTAPFERMLGFTILGNGTVRTIQQGRNVNF